jgi:hypothetical protein
MLKNLVAMATKRLKYGKFNTLIGFSDNAKNTENIFVKLDTWGRWQSADYGRLLLFFLY